MSKKSTWMKKKQVKKKKSPVAKKAPVAQKKKAPDAKKEAPPSANPAAEATNNSETQANVITQPQLVHIKVTDPSNLPIEGATVRLEAILHGAHTSHHAASSSPVGGNAGEPPPLVGEVLVEQRSGHDGVVAVMDVAALLLQRSISLEFPRVIAAGGAAAAVRNRKMMKFSETTLYWNLISQ